MVGKIRSRRLLALAAALFGGLVLIVMASGTTAGATDGAGVMSVTPSTVAAGESVPTLTFDFYNDALLAFTGGSEVTLYIPSGWSDPNGHISVAEGAGFGTNTCDPGTTSITGNGTTGWTILIPMTCGWQDHLTIVYSSVTATSTLGNSTFTTKSQDGIAGLRNIGTSPTVAVKTSQTITFGALPARAYGDAPFSLSATASSGLTVSFSATGNCTVSGSTLTITGAGSCSVTASQAGNATYAPAPTVTQSFTIAKAAQSITFGALPEKALGTGTVNLTATASSGLAVTYAASGSCTVSGHTLTLTAVGLCSVTASQGGSANWLPATDVPQSFTVTQGSQTITFGALPNRTYGGGPYTLTATASSGLSVSYAASGNCTVSGHTLTITGAGSCSVTASQGGNASWAPAADVTRSFTIAKAGQVLVFLPIFDQIYGQAPLTLYAWSSVGLDITFTTTGPCTVSGSTLTLTGAGTCSVTASQPGDDNYEAATPWTWTFTIAKASQTITFAALPNVRLDQGPITLTATASSGLTVGYTATGSCTVSGATLTLTGVGSCSVTASQPGDANYRPATNVSRGFNITQGAQTITFGALPDKVLGDPSIDLTGAASASSGLPVGYSVTGDCSLSGATLTLTGVGSCSVTASQPGDANWQAAADVSRSFDILKTGQTITFAQLPDATYGDGPIPLAATASSGLPVSYAVLGQCSISGATLSITGAGSCSVTASQDGDGSNAPARSVTWTFTIGKHLLTVTAADKTRHAATANPPLTATMSGFVNGDTSAVVTGTPSLSTAADASSSAGTYPILAACTGLGADNYSFTCVDGTLTVTNKLVLTVTAENKVRDYNTPNPTLTYTITGYDGDDNISSLSHLPSCATTALTASLPGYYQITCEGAASEKYEFTYATGQLTIQGSVVGGETATPPVTSSSPAPTPPSGDPASLGLLMLVCLVFGGAGLFAVGAQARAMRR